MAKHENPYELKRVTFADWQPEPPPDPIFARRMRKLRVERVLAVVGLVVVYGAAFVFLKHAATAFSGTWVVAAIFVNWVWSRRARPDTAYLFDIPATVPQFPVDFRLKCNNKVLGTDSGALSFVGSRLRYEGRTVSFDVDRYHVAAVANYKNNQGRRVGGQSRAKLTLSYGFQNENWQIELLPYDRVEGLGSGLFDQCLDAAWAWIGEAPDSTSRANLPPRVPSKGQMAAYRRWVKGGLAAAVVGVIATGLLFGIGQRNDWTLVPVMISGILTLLAALIAEVQNGELGVLRQIQKAHLAELTKRSAVPAPAVNVDQPVTETRSVLS